MVKTTKKQTKYNVYKLYTIDASDNENTQTPIYYFYVRDNIKINTGKCHENSLQTIKNCKAPGRKIITDYKEMCMLSIVCQVESYRDAIRKCNELKKAKGRRCVNNCNMNKCKYKEKQKNKKYYDTHSERIKQLHRRKVQCKKCGRSIGIYALKKHQTRTVCKSANEYVIPGGNFRHSPEAFMCIPPKIIYNSDQGTLTSSVYNINQGSRNIFQTICEIVSQREASLLE